MVFVWTVEEYDDVKVRVQCTWPQVAYYNRFSYTCGCANTILIRSVWTRIFSNTEKKISVVENIRTRVDGALNYLDVTRYTGHWLTFEM